MSRDVRQTHPSTYAYSRDSVCGDPEKHGMRKKTSPSQPLACGMEPGYRADNQAFRAEKIESNGSPAVSTPRPGPILPCPAAVPGAVRRTIPRTVSRTVPRTIPGTVLRSAPGTAARAVSRAVSTAVPAPRSVARTIPRSIAGSIPRAISRALPRAIATPLSVSGGGPPPVPTGGAVVLLVPLPLRHRRCARQRLIKRRFTIRRSTRHG